MSPMGIVSDSEFESEYNNSGPTIPIITEVVPSIIEMEKPGRKEGDVGVPESLQKIIGETSVIDGRHAALDLAKQFDISPSSVSAYNKGATSTASYNEPKSDLKNHINQAKERISKKARIRLVRALDALTEEKINDSKAVDIASVAKSMSAVIKDMEPESTTDTIVNRPQFIFYAPGFKSESAYDAIYSKE